MIIRELREQYEQENLSPYATKSVETKGHKHSYEQCDIRTEFQKDRDKITHCKAFRRLMHKTQVFIAPEGDHYRTRLTHTLEVAQISRTVSRALALNEDLTEAIALGHDLGHTPFGHAGEDALALLSGFRHNEQSVRIVEVLENDGEGLNLTYEVLDGILNHRMICTPSTLEGQVVQLCDKIAYMNHDIDDAIRAKLLVETDLPPQIRELLGQNSVKRINFIVHNLIEHSIGKPKVSPSPDVETALKDLRTFMYSNVYTNQLHARERNKIEKMLHLLHEHYVKYPEKLPEDLQHRITQDADRHQVAIDYIAGMTDRFAMKRFSEIFIPSSWEVKL